MRMISIAAAVVAALLAYLYWRAIQHGEEEQWDDYLGW
jgi:hypothetical protein